MPESAAGLGQKKRRDRVNLLQTSTKGILRQMCRMLVVSALLVLALPNILRAQEMEPRAYASSPVGFAALAVAYSRTDGELVFDPTVPIENVDAGINAAAAGYFQSFDLFGRSSNVSVYLPYVWGDLSGDVGGTATAITRSGLGDARIRLAANLFGAPAMTPVQFSQHVQKTNLGISVAASLPTGQYDRVKLINVGANRWAVKPEIGVSHRQGTWLLESALGVWLISQNSHFYGGSVRRQSPVVSLQANAIWNINRRTWISFGGNFYRGGRAETNGNKSSEQFRNSRLGTTCSYRFSRSHSVGLSFNKGAVTRIGGNFSLVTVSYQFTFVP